MRAGIWCLWLFGFSLVPTPGLAKEDCSEPIKPKFQIPYGIGAGMSVHTTLPAKEDYQAARKLVIVPVDVLVNRSGRVVCASAPGASPLREVAKAAARRWIYQPYAFNGGEYVPILTRIIFLFDHQGVRLARCDRFSHVPLDRACKLQYPAYSALIHRKGLDK